VVENVAMQLLFNVVIFSLAVKVFTLWHELKG
jgi:hypothetical protein